MPLERVDRVVVRKSRRDRGLGTTRGILQTVLEAGNKAPLADDDIDIRGCATFKGLAINFADEVDLDLVAVLGDTLCLRLVNRVALGQIGERGIQVRFPDLGHEALHLKRLEVDQVDRRNDFVGHGIREVLATRDDLFDFRLILGKGDIGLSDRALVAVIERLLAALFHRLLQDLQHQTAPKHFLQMEFWHLALAKAAQLHIILDFVETLFAPLIEVGHRQDDLNFALQAIGTCLSYLHVSNPYGCCL